MNIISHKQAGRTYTNTHTHTRKQTINSAVSQYSLVILRLYFSQMQLHQINQYFYKDGFKVHTKTDLFPLKLREGKNEE